MFQASLPIKFWSECVQAAVYLINRTPTTLLNGKSPYEILFGSRPDLSLLRTFGCLCYAHNQPRVKDKFGPRSRRCIFLGYHNGKKGWKVFDLESKEVFKSRDVRFIEDSFPFATPEVMPIQELQSYPFVDLDVPILDDRGSTNVIAPSTDAPVNSSTVPSREQRSRHPPAYLADYICHSARTRHPVPSQSNVVTSSGTKFLIAHYVTYNNFFTGHRKFLVSVTTNVEPRSYKEAVVHDRWRKAMQQEIEALEKNHT